MKIWLIMLAFASFLAIITTYYFVCIILAYLLTWVFEKITKHEVSFLHFVLISFILALIPMCVLCLYLASFL